MEAIIVLIIVVCAAVYVLRSFSRMGKGAGGGCGTCQSGCPSRKSCHEAKRGNTHAN